MNSAFAAALCDDKLKFVKLCVDLGFDVNTYVTLEKLEQLYRDTVIRC
jgi:hypothetical protein